MQFKPLVGLDYEYFFQIANTLILFFLLKRLLFGPIQKVIANRQANIAKDMELGKKELQEGQALKKKYEEKMKGFHDEGTKIISDAKKDAEKIAGDIVEGAKLEAESIKTKANLDIEREKQKAINEIKGDISSMVMLAASKVVERDLDQAQHERFIEEFINEVGEAK